MTQVAKPFTFDRVIRIGITLAVLWGIVWLLGYLQDVLVPFAVALLLAYLINPFIELLQRWIRNRVAAVLLGLLLILVIIILAGWLIIPLIFAEFSAMGGILADLVTNSDLSGKVSEMLPADVWQSVRDWAASPQVQDFFNSENFWQSARELSTKVLPGTWTVISGTATFLLGILGMAVIALYLIFLLLDFQKVRGKWRELLPPKYSQRIISFVEDFGRAMNRYFRAQAAVASITGLIFAVGFWAIGLPLGILLGLLIGLLNMVPYLQIIGLIPAYILAALHGLDTSGSIWLMVGLTTVVFAIAQSFQDMFLVPRIMGKVTGLSPAVILLSLSIWGKLLGLLGLIIALPMSYLLLTYYESYLKQAGNGETEVQGSVKTIMKAQDISN